MTRLDLVPALRAPDLLARPVRDALAALEPELAGRIRVAPIDPASADTAAFCAAYDVAPAASANCLVVAARRGQTTTHAACVVLATTRADVNGVVRRLLDARRASFAAMDAAVAATGMEYGGITPLGLPASWRILMDARVAEVDRAIIGSGLRASKIALPGSALAALPGVELVHGLARDLEPSG